jgi:hypothetical protein
MNQCSDALSSHLLLKSLAPWVPHNELVPYGFSPIRDKRQSQRGTLPKTTEVLPRALATAFVPIIETLEFDAQKRRL